MADNTKQIIERIQSSFPHIYDVYNEESVLYTLISIFGSRYGARADIMDRLYAMIGIDSTYDEDLEYRWGSLLSVYRQAGESHIEYRNRLKIVYTALSGGTADAIKYAIASAAEIEDMVDIDKYIHVYDAWEYPYDIDMSLLGINEVIDESSLYGSIICTLDLISIDTINYSVLMNAINQIKASGINSYLLFLYNSEEFASLPRNMDDNNYMNIRYEVSDNGKFYNTNMTSAIFGEAMLGSATFNGISSNMDYDVDTFVDIITQSAFNDFGSIIAKGIDHLDHIILPAMQDMISVAMSDIYNPDMIVNEINESTEISMPHIHNDKIAIDTQESVLLDKASNIWSSVGTNSAILNRTFKTNISAESDEHIDIIQRTALFGEGIIGHATLGIKI